MKALCRTCGLFNTTESICRLTSKKVDPDESFCSRHRQTVYHCETCNNITLNPTWTQDGDTWRCYCSKCAEELNTCRFCRLGLICAFETDPDPLPKIITQQQRSPFGIQQTQTRNPAREEKFCMTCRCWSTDLQVCGKQLNYCCHLDHIFEEKKEEKEEEKN